MDRRAGSIRTPDQRLRVFVSSTLNELSAERKAVRSAIERLRLAPVMFELGARPHAPRDLYRAYLEQSDVFVGLYWERYGWVAPGEEVSGLEDEYNLAGALPKLIYIKQPSSSREPRLATLLDRIVSDDAASYKRFSTPEELADLLEGDLATMLAERFDQGARVPATVTASIPIQPVSSFPVPLTQLVGRAREVATVAELLSRPSVRLVTLTGPGGMGKSRLSIDVARSMEASFSGGLAFVNLAPVNDPALVPAAIAHALGVRDSGDEPIQDKLVRALSHREMLVVIDNFEQVVDAAPVLTAMLAGSPGLRLLVTSRTLLRLQGEHTVEVGPLGLPESGRRQSPQSAAAAPAVELFIERARAVKPDFELTDGNVGAVIRICSALDGMPLAIELAAARVRTLPPAAMLARLDRQLPLLVGGLRDLPARQQTLRRAIEWSSELLDADERALLSVLGIFSGSFSLEAAEYVADGRVPDVLGSIGLLVDGSMVRQHDRMGSASFSLLSTMREYAREQLDESGDLAEVQRVHAEYYRGLAARISTDLKGPRQRELVELLTDERDNVRSAIRRLLSEREWDDATDFAWNLYIYWWVGGHLGEVPAWMQEVIDSGDVLSDRARAIALYFTKANAFWQHPDDTIVPGLIESATLFHAVDEPSGEALARVSIALAMLSPLAPDPAGADDNLEQSLTLFRHGADRWGESMALVTLGRVALFQQKANQAINRFEESLALARVQGDELGTGIALNHLGWGSAALGDVDAARAYFRQNLEISARLGHDEGVAYGFEGLLALAASAGRIERAGLLLGASQALREQTGMYEPAGASFHQGAVDAITASEHAAAFREAVHRGRDLSLAGAIEVALGGDE